MLDRIAKGLAAQFDRHRIVFWYDPNHEFRQAFEMVALDGIEKVELANTEFAVKHRVLREKPKQRFLLYREGPRPADIDNWLLDVELAHGVFKADQIAIWLTDLGLPVSFEALAREHQEFFRSTRRLERLKAVIRGDDTKPLLRLRMLVICACADGDFDTVVEALLGELAQGKDDSLRLIGRVGLHEFLWDQIARIFGYRAEKPSIGDFAITLFKSCYQSAVGGETILTSEAMVFFRRWKNNRNAEDAFAKLSADYAEVLGIAQDLARRDFRTLIEVDYFEEVDRAIIRALVHEVSNQTAAQADVANWIRQRRQSHWYSAYRDLYEAIGFAAEFQQSMAQVTVGMTSLAEGVERYAISWFRIDQLYRKFIWRMQKSGQATLMRELFEQVENHYVNNYLLRLNDVWQTHVDAAISWSAPPILPQRSFYREHVGEFRRRDQKVCVIISDALRYEIGEELLGRIRSVDRYEAGIEPMLGSLPSYTQLGMASLLPNGDLQIADNDSGTVLVNGQSSQGLDNRSKVLATGRAGDRTTAVKVEDLMGMDKEEARALVRDHDVVYVFHNLIDAIGDKQVSEDRVFEAADDTIEELVRVVKKLNGANANNLIVTSDHGFIYQHRPIEESDYSSAQVEGDTILFRDRRFILGHGLKGNRGLRRFTAEQAGLEGSVEMLIPKSISRLRRQGSGSRYVHGGATLQEIIVPVVKINKKRQSDTSAVDVEIIGSTNQMITSSQISVRFYQVAAVTEKTQARTLRAGIYAQSGELISDTHELVFDFRSENPREREVSVRFLLLRQADTFNGQEVILRLEERHGDTSHFREYRTARYTLRRSFSSDFDF
ncbi:MULTISPECIES: BREX-1 system phosphatase PglZ type A [unclassified Bradyrhizobium]|uniref:BREX-1 system phosphatase PglZ type A n=1 Tax=unclassified Bradyrhizobium TaxID=2631580 RepID=UPI001CD25315|nr:MULTISPECIES: BREX-1 system phosphatase PglZ type A [unclassified Bradyrhizobium]MCA1398427.1 BREX-1 system phosphatase PglZ type A [Bradyrhizobium sp. BRP56]UWU92690.1 BREX-1 system phosphatase PglZ type A [Bradyrhizobium sp. CB1015]